MRRSAAPWRVGWVSSLGLFQLRVISSTPFCIPGLFLVIQYTCTKINNKWMGLYLENTYYVYKLIIYKIIDFNLVQLNYLLAFLLVLWWKGCWPFYFCHTNALNHILSPYLCHQSRWNYLKYQKYQSVWSVTSHFIFFIYKLNDKVCQSNFREKKLKHKRLLCSQPWSETRSFFLINHSTLFYLQLSYIQGIR